MIELLHMDCMDYMREQPDKAFDICITSPPYNMNLRTNANNDGYTKRYISVEKSTSTKYKNNGDRLTMEEYKNFLVDFIEQTTRISNLVFINIQQVTGNKPALYKAIGHHADKLKETIIWDKKNSNPAIQDGVLNSLFEFIFVFGGNNFTRKFENSNFGRGEVDNIWRINPASQNKNNKASFPIEIPQKILHLFTSPGDRLIDPCLGTGTTAIAAHYFGVDFVGIEIDEDYYNAACKRFDDETAQKAMF